MLLRLDEQSRGSCRSRKTREADRDANFTGTDKDCRCRASSKTTEKVGKVLNLWQILGE